MPAIRTRRLSLVAMSPELMTAILAGDWARAGLLVGAPMPEEWRSESWSWLRETAAQTERDPAAAEWGPRLLLLEPPSSGRGVGPIVVGEAGFHGPPDADGRAEFGYQVVTEHRRQGFAEEAVTGLLSWAEVDHGVTRFRATVAPDNQPSLALLRKLGFRQTGRVSYPDRGEELVFLRGRAG